MYHPTWPPILYWAPLQSNYYTHHPLSLPILFHHERIVNYFQTPTAIIIQHWRQFYQFLWSKTCTASHHMQYPIWPTLSLLIENLNSSCYTIYLVFKIVSFFSVVNILPKLNRPIPQILLRNWIFNVKKGFVTLSRVINIRIYMLRYCHF